MESMNGIGLLTFFVIKVLLGNLTNTLGTFLPVPGF